MNLKDFIYSQKIEKTHTVTRILGIKFKIPNGRWEMKIKRKEKPYDIGILSFNIHSATYNFGAALHSFAFQKYLDKLGINNVIVNYYPETVKQNFITAKIIKSIQEKDYSLLKQNLIYGLRVLQKKIKFEKFFKKHCRVTKYRYELDTIAQLKSINRYVCETDITWAKFKIGGYDRVFFCDLPNMKKKDNVAYSVDFGYGSLTGKNASMLTKYAKNFKYISVRNILKLDDFKNAISRDDVEVTIDPVFLLPKEDYEKISIKPKIKEDFVLVYNCADNNLDMREKAAKFAKEKNMKVIEINSYSRNILDFQDSLPTPIGIEEFLGLFQNCKYLFTNSYHGICFGLIFQKPLFIFSRIFESEKLYVLMNLFGLQDRFVNEEDEIEDRDMDYKAIDQRMSKWLDISKEFIQKSVVNDFCNKGRE